MKTLIAVPCMDMMNTQFVASLIALEKRDAEIVFVQNSLVYDSRNELASRAIDNGFDRVLWLDSDMKFDPDTLERLHADMDNGMEFVCGLYFKRKYPVTPCIYKALYITKDGENRITPHADIFTDYPRDEVFRISACGFGMVLTSVDLLRRVREKFGLPFSPTIGFGEDLSFCMRASALEVPMYCDGRIKVGHIGYTEFTEETYNKGLSYDSPTWREI